MSRVVDWQSYFAVFMHATAQSSQVLSLVIVTGMVSLCYLASRLLLYTASYITAAFECYSYRHIATLEMSHCFDALTVKQMTHDMHAYVHALPSNDSSRQELVDIIYHFYSDPFRLSSFGRYCFALLVQAPRNTACLHQAALKLAWPFMKAAQVIRLSWLGQRCMPAGFIVWLLTRL